MTSYQPGDIVDINIRSARVTNSFLRRHLDEPAVTILVADYTDGSERSVAVNLDAESVTVDRVASADWPPEPGDLWASPLGNGTRLWFVQSHAHTPECDRLGCDYEVELVDAERERYAIGRTVPAALRPLTLMYREG